MIKLINEETGKEVFKIKDDGSLEKEGKEISGEKEIKEAVEKAKEKGEE